MGIQYIFYDLLALLPPLQGTRTSQLLLSNLEVGDYMFTLKVTDAANQVSTADIHVYVKPGTLQLSFFNKQN